MRFPRGTAPVLSVLLAAVLLSGCAQAEPEPQESASPEPVETPVVEEPTGPQSLFDDDCAQLLTPEDAATILGAPVQLAARFREAGDVAIRQLGGIHCVWSDPAVSGPFLSMVVLPARVSVDDARKDEFCEEGRCSFVATAAGFDVYGLIGVPGEAEAGTLARAAASKEAFTLAVAPASVPPVYQAAGAWAVPVDCAALDASDVVATAIGDPAAEGFLTGGDAEPNTGFYVAHEAAGAALCGWDSETGGITADILPGGAWIEDEIAALDGAQESTVTGVDSAVVIDDVLHVFSGDNWIVLQGTLDEVPIGVEVLGAAAASLVAELDAA